MNTAKAAIEAEHLQLVRRVFKALPDPLPDAAKIRAAFKADPEYKTLTGRNAERVMKLIIDRCLYNGWRIPDALKSLEHWGSLFVRWHWFCTDKLKLSGPNALPRQWEGKPKALVEKAHPLLQPPKKRKPSRNYWFDHAPFRLMFGNQTCGMSWLKEEFAASRTFLLLDSATHVQGTGLNLRCGIVPRESRFCPYTLPDAQPGEESFLLYEESQGEAPRLRAVPKERIVIPARKGLVFLFDLDGKAIRVKNNLNALYLRALFSPVNLQRRDIHLDGDTEFHVRKGTDIPREKVKSKSEKAGKLPEHFRMRFTEDRLFVTLRLTFNPQMVSTGGSSQAFGSLSSYIAANPSAKFITVGEGKHQGAHPSAEAGAATFLSPQPDSREHHSCGDRNVAAPAEYGNLVGALARRVIAEDACVLFARGTPKRLLKAVREKFEYIVLKDRALTEDGGALRGYQLADRLFVGDMATANEELKVKNEELKKREAEAAACAARAAQRAENRAKAERQRQIALQRRRAIIPDFSVEPFQTGAFRFKVEFKTSDNQRHETECRADARDEMFAKMRTVGIRPSRVTQLDPAPAATTTAVAAATIAERLRRLDALKEQGLIIEAEHAAQRERILGEL